MIMSLITTSQQQQRLSTTNSSNNNLKLKIVPPPPSSSSSSINSSNVDLITTSAIINNNSNMMLTANNNSSGNHLPVPIPSSSSSSSSLSSTSIIRPLIDLIDGQIIHLGDVLGPIPNLFKWLRSELDRVEQCLERSSKIPCSSSTIVEMAMTKLEQNLEIFYYNEQYYFEVIRTFRVCQQPQQQNFSIESTNDEKPKAWFNHLIEERLTATIRPIQTWLNGKELFGCIWCNHFSFYPNHMILHIIMDCMKNLTNITNDNGQKNRHNSRINETPKQSINYHPIDHHQPDTSRKHEIRSFDIMSLLNQKDRKSSIDDHHDHDHDDDYNNNQDVDIEIDVETLDDDNNNSGSMIAAYKIPTMMMMNNNMNGQKRSKRSSSIPTQPPPSSSSIVSNQYQTPSSSTSTMINPSINRKYNRKLSSNNNKSGNKISQLNINTSSSSSSSNYNQSKSAFKKLKTIKTTNKSTNSGHQSVITSNQFISNLNLTNFYNQISTEQSNGGSKFPLANLFNNRNGSTSINPSSSSPSPSSSMLLNSPEHQPYTFGSSNISSPPSSSMNGTKMAMLSSPISVRPTFESNNTTTTTTATNYSLESSGSLDLSADSSSSSLSLDSDGSNSPKQSSKDYHNNGDTNQKQDSNEHLVVTKDGSSSPSSSSSSSMIQLLPQSSMANNPLMNLPPYFMPPTTSASAAAANPLITSLYLLSPSLTALSYQASNVCAYCNQAFRMTSDLVYHMRSHHKRTKIADELVNKKRRDDQLRCNICNETFRERHHLTRHMTSHQ
ncbi:LOW QUALITY PROTEIN: uncharacterized protein LOC124496891 [Dermatophagoides farinae]|uniref:LOW QUALITY PROTEIN: uncharacterized protein LOC124496891 n=1 Tax=Dermatophagoides farinae TaxID=6954 RepID=UPI003F62B427